LSLSILLGKNIGINVADAAGDADVLDLLSAVISLCVNLIATLMIAFRAWYVQYSIYLN
jgi:hypothetical protein